MNKNHFDYIICGGGASGLLLAYRICNDPYFIDNYTDLATLGFIGGFIVMMTLDVALG